MPIVNRGMGNLSVAGFKGKRAYLDAGEPPRGVTTRTLRKPPPTELCNDPPGAIGFDSRRHAVTSAGRRVPRCAVRAASHHYHHFAG